MKIRMLLFHKFHDSVKYCFLAFPLFAGILNLDKLRRNLSSLNDKDQSIVYLYYIHVNYRRYIKSFDLAMKIHLMSTIVFMLTFLICLVFSSPTIFGFISLIYIPIIVYLLMLIVWKEKLSEMKRMYDRYIFLQNLRSYQDIPRQDKQYRPKAAPSVNNIARSLKVLGLPDNCSNMNTIRTRYKFLMKKYHPDIYHGADANQKSRDIIQAYQNIEKILS